jgi:hypothetical protein
MAEISEDLIKTLISAIQENTAFVKNMSRDIQQLRSQAQEALNAVKEAESEIPEKMRRFIMYFHDAHDILHLYHENGLEPPKWVQHEVERCADRFKHLVEDLHAPGETFDQVRKEMSTRGGNRYDWSKQLMAPPKEKIDETR